MRFHVIPLWSHTSTALTAFNSTTVLSPALTALTALNSTQQHSTAPLTALTV
jgi:hypothetical protein